MELQVGGVGSLVSSFVRGPISVDSVEGGAGFENIGEREQRFADTTYQHAGIGIAEVDAEGRLQLVNPHLAELLGETPARLVGRSIFDPSLTVDAEEDRGLFARQVRGELDTYHVEKTYRRPDGSRVWIAVRSSAVRDADGKFLHAVRIQQDITARKQAETALARRVEEQEALYEFTDGLQRAATLAEVYDLALATIVRALGCDRAAVLLFDGAGQMRFVASRGLSQAYCRAVEGHSPWRPGAIDPRPLAIADIAEGDLPDALERAVAAEGIRALSFIPILSGRRLLGKFMTYYDAPHRFADSETMLAQNVARQLGFAIDRLQIEAERAKAERAARQLVAIVESSNDAIVSKNLDGVITSWNASAERMFGYRAEEAIGKPITLIIPQDRLAEEPQIIARIRRGERVDHFETVRRRKDGSLLDISLTISPIRDSAGAVVGASKIARDITERRQADAKIAASERRLRDLLAAIPAAIYTTDAAGRITYFNDAAIELSGRVPEIGTDQWCVTWKLYRPDGTFLPHDECPMAVALKEGRPIRNVEAVAERPDGTRIPFIPYPTPMFDEDGNVTGAINMLVDISERKQAETQQRLLFDELNHRVKNNMQTLQALLILSGQKTGNEDAQRVLNEAGNRINAMAAAHQILYRTAQATHFSAKSLMDAVCEAASQVLPKTVRIRPRADEIELSNDTAVPIALILNELLTNAVKYGASNGETVIDTGLVGTELGYLLYVDDEGPGFDLQAVRDRWSGLRLVQGLARQLRGELAVTTIPRTRCSIQFA